MRSKVLFVCALSLLLLEVVTATASYFTLKSMFAAAPYFAQVRLFSGLPLAFLTMPMAYWSARKSQEKP